MAGSNLVDRATLRTSPHSRGYFITWSVPDAIATVNPQKHWLIPATVKLYSGALEHTIRGVSAKTLPCQITTLEPYVLRRDCYEPRLSL